VASLAIVGVRSGPWLFLREASFIRWFGGMVLHVLAHLARLIRFRP
jgi:hypothetical protein